MQLVFYLNFQLSSSNGKVINLILIENYFINQFSNHNSKSSQQNRLWLRKLTLFLIYIRQDSQMKVLSSDITQVSYMRVANRYSSVYICATLSSHCICANKINVITTNWIAAKSLHQPGNFTYEPYHIHAWPTCSICPDLFVCHFALRKSHQPEDSLLLMDLYSKVELIFVFTIVKFHCRNIFRKYFQNPRKCLKAKFITHCRLGANMIPKKS